MIGQKDRQAGSSIAALRLAQCLFKTLVENGGISKEMAAGILVHAAAESGDNKYAWHLLAEMRDWLDKQPDA